MSKGREAIIELHAHNAHPSVEQRITRRLDVLREWLRDGIPAGKSLPQSLNAAREWDDPDLGIVRIASPNEFTTTHSTFGSRVRDIASLLTDLRKKFKRPSKATASKPVGQVAKFDRRDFDRQIAAVVSQWHTERDQHLLEKKRADAAEARSLILLKELAEKETLISDLRRQLAYRNGLRIVE
jgi:hypothetical protein